MIMLGVGLASACVGCLEPETRERQAAGTHHDESAGVVPHVNSLGMRFVPVPIQGGPADGKTVMFCVWETRVRDYAAFVRTTGRRWTRPAFEQTDEHPAVNVSWEDARDFCAWLTRKERAAGLVGGESTYRLPTDHEWSCAVGIGDRESSGATPEQKDGKIRGVYPWGTQWPPPMDTAGNFGEEELARELWEKTSPAGSFTPNRLGLFDLGGNAWEWCQDRYEASEEWRILRGASWEDDAEAKLGSSARIHASPDTRLDIFGFRCVLENGS